MVLSVKLSDELDRRLSEIARARSRSKSKLARDAIEHFVAAAEEDGPLRFSYPERLQMMLQANWHAFPSGHSERVPPELILEMTANGDEALLPVLLEDCGPTAMGHLGTFVSHLRLSKRDIRLKEVTSLVHKLRFRQYYKEAPAFTGISDDREANRFARYYWLLHRCFDEDKYDEHDDVFPGLRWDFTAPAEPIEYWIGFAKDLSIAEITSKDAGWELRRSR